MLAEVRGAIRRERMLPPGAPLWVAVSGGVDSMVLLHVLHTLGHSCAVAHVDHGLRGAESDADRTFVEGEARRMGLVFRTMRVDPKAVADEQGISLQMAARQARYGWFATLLREGPSTMALGHHRDDAMETLMIHLLRGTGLRGWSGIPPVSFDQAHPSGAYVRPLIGIDRAHILAYAQAHDIPFREDGSNRDPKYLRNRIRHELMPFLEGLRPGARRTLGRSMELLRELTTAAQAQVHRELNALSSEEGDGRRIPFAVLDASRTPRLLLLQLLHGTELHPDVLDRLMEAIAQRATGALFHAGDRRITVDREAVLIDHAPDGFPSFRIDEGGSPRRTGPFDRSWVDASAIDMSQGMDVAWLDGDALAFPLELRPWRAGDRMRPLGLQGSKAISDILIDAKVPRAAKAGVYVLVSGGTIVWLVGHRIAEGYAATAATARVLRIAHVP